VAILFSMKKFNNLGKGMNVVVLPLDEHELAILAPCERGGSLVLRICVKFFQALEEGKKLLVWWSELLLDATLDDVSLPAVSSPPALDRPGLMTGSGRMSRPPAGFASPAAEKKETLNKRKTNAKQTRLQKKTKNKPISESESEETPAANQKNRKSEKSYSKHK